MILDLNTKKISWSQPFSPLMQAYFLSPELELSKHAFTIYGALPIKSPRLGLQITYNWIILQLTKSRLLM